MSFIKLLCLCLALLSFNLNSSFASTNLESLKSYEDSPEFLRPDTDPDYDSKSTGPILSHIFKVVKNDGTRQVLAIQNFDSLVKPASTMKLFTGWWALQEGIRELDYLSLMLKTSSNAMAQATLDLLGKPSDMEDYYSLQGLTINSETFRVADGSGLSYSNKSTCGVQIQLLELIYASSQYEVFRDLLATPGENGTLRSRLLDLKGKVFAKTGTLNRTAALSGFVETDNGTIIFCVLSDFIKTSLQVERKRIDELVRANYKLVND